MIDFRAPMQDTLQLNYSVLGPPSRNDDTLILMPLFFSVDVFNATVVVVVVVVVQVQIET